MELTKKEDEEMCKIFRSKYGVLQVTEDGGAFAVDKKTALSLVEKQLVEYTNLGTTKFVRLTKKRDPFYERGKKMRASEFKKIQRLARLDNKEVAERLHVSVSLVEKMRSGKRIITNHMAFVICEVLQKKGAAPE